MAPDAKTSGGTLGLWEAFGARAAEAIDDGEAAKNRYRLGDSWPGDRFFQSAARVQFSSRGRRSPHAHRNRQLFLHPWRLPDFLFRTAREDEADDGLPTMDKACLRRHRHVLDLQSQPGHLGPVSIEHEPC